MSEKTPRLWRIEDGHPHLSLHPGQKQAWNSTRRFIAIIAGTQSGKTSFLPWWLAREIETCGPGDYIAATASFDLFKLKFLPAIREVFEHITRWGRYWAADRVIELADPEKGFLAKQSTDPMWGRIILRSASAGGGLESATAKAALLDEAGQDEFAVEDWEAVLRRLSLSQGRVLLGTTPYNLAWLKTEIYDRWVAGHPDYEVVQFASTMNPLFPQAEMDRARATMPAWRFAMMYQGRFERPAGLIYDCFNPDLHKVDPFPIPPDWLHYAGADFGGVNTAMLWLAYDRSADRYFLFDESLTGGLTTREHAQSAREKAIGRKLMGAWGGAKSEEQTRRDFTQEGFRIREPLIWEVEPGIERVYRLIKEDRLFVFSTCTGTLDELGSYRRKLDPSGQPTEEIADKRKYHHLDGLRYLASALPERRVSISPALLAGSGARRRPVPF